MTRDCMACARACSVVPRRSNTRVIHTSDVMRSKHVPLHAQACFDIAHV